MTTTQVNTEAAARKRQAAGLPSQRETAHSVVERPPLAVGEPRWRQWLLVLLIAAMLSVGALLAVAKLAGAPTNWIAVHLAIMDFIDRLVERGDDPAPAEGSITETISDEFKLESSVLVRDFQPNRWTMGTIAAEGVYRIRMYPNVVAWSTLGLDNPQDYRFSTSMMISPDTPWGYGGMIARLEDEENLALLLVDGQGRYRVQVQQNGRWATLRDWSAAPNLAGAGTANELALEDAGEVMRFVANGETIFQTRAITLAPGDLGVIAGSLEQSVAEVDFDWVKLEPLVQ